MKRSRKLECSFLQPLVPIKAAREGLAIITGLKALFLGFIDPKLCPRLCVKCLTFYLL